MIVYQTRLHPYAQVLRRGTNILRDVITYHYSEDTGNITVSLKKL